jgi:hypothetical protein
MVTVYLIGGIGNQLFQYAAGFSLSQKLNVSLKLDKSYYKEQHYEGDKLTEFYHIPYYANILENTFEISAQEATEDEINPFRHSIPKKMIERLKPYYRRKIFREQGFFYDSNFFTAGKNVLLKGNWQSEKYFNHVAGLLKKEFSFKKRIKETNILLSEQTNASQSVGVHIRRRDYVNHPVTSWFLGALDINYYKTAIQYMKSNLPGPHYFYFFSDDMEWVKENFTFVQNKIFIDQTHKLSDTDELYLMSQCRHNIIANSSFSWWGAWLNNNPDKIVIAPKKWFNKGPNDTQDLIPNGWIKI